jgi:hypothetical protein
MPAWDMGIGPGTRGPAPLPSLGLWVVMMVATMLSFRAALRVIDAEVTRRAAAARLPAAA